MYVWDRTSFSTEDKLKNVPMNVIGKLSVDRPWPDTTHINVVVSCDKRKKEIIALYRFVVKPTSVQ